MPRADPIWGLRDMAHDGSVTRLIQLLRSDDTVERDLAAQLIWRRYFRDLLELARNNLNKRIRRREDEEDVLQSMYKSFCLRQQRGEFDLAGRDALWKLLVTITLRKARNTAKKQGREMRDVAREQTVADGDETAISSAGRSNRWMPPVPRRRRPPCSTRRSSVGWRRWPTPSCARSRSGGWRVTPTARSLEKLDCTERSVERRLERIRSKWTSYDDGTT